MDRRLSVRIRRVGLLWLLAAFLIPNLSVAAGGTLRPDSAKAIQAIFDQLKPELAWDSIQIAQDKVRVRLCPAQAGKSDCFSFELLQPGAGCSGQIEGAFCLVFTDGKPAVAAVDRLTRTLRESSGQGLWESPHDEKPPEVTGTSHPPAMRFNAWVHGYRRRIEFVLSIGAPLLAGVLLGVVVRRQRKRRFEGTGSLLVSLSTPVLLILLIPQFYSELGRWDAVVEGVLAGLGFCWSAHRGLSDRHLVAMTATLTAVGLLALEGVTRWLLPPLPGFSVETPGFLVNPVINQPIFAGAQDHVCTIAYPGVYRSRFGVNTDADVPNRRSRLSLPHGSFGRVLHLGDSMTYGLGVTPEDTFAADLADLDPAVEHINTGIVGTGPDDYLIVLRRWLERTEVRLAVMYLFEGNDLGEIDKGHQCSNWEGILSYDKGAVALHYPDGPREAHANWEWFHLTSPPPFIVRAFVNRSKLAALIAIAISRLRAPDVNALESDEVRWNHLDAILRAARDETQARGAELVVVVLPLAASVEKGQPGEIAQRMVQVARGVGVPVLDPGDMFREAAARGEPIFLSKADMHFSPTGHRLLAQWLYDHLPAVTPGLASVH